MVIESPSPQRAAPAQTVALMNRTYAFEGRSFDAFI